MVFGMFTCRDYMKSMSAVMFEYNMFKISCRYLQPFREINFSNKYESRNRAAIFVTAQFETWFSELMRLTRDNMRPLFKLYHSLWKNNPSEKSQFAPVMFCPFQFLLWNRRVENLPRIICGNTSALPGPMRSLRLVSNKIKTAQHLLGTTCPSPLNIRVVFSEVLVMIYKTFITNKLSTIESWDFKHTMFPTQAKWRPISAPRLIKNLWMNVFDWWMN